MTPMTVAVLLGLRWLGSNWENVIRDISDFFRDL